jgi:hypothetical protein
MSFRFKVVFSLAACALAAVASLPAAVRADAPAACGSAAPLSFRLIGPPAGASGVATTFRTIYLAIPGSALSALPPSTQTRVLLVDDAGETTEGGVLHPTSLDALPNTVSAPDGATKAGLAFSYTWVPALRASTHYTAMLARLDAGNCVFARLGDFTTGAGT